MTEYCITAVNNSNEDKENHNNAQFKVWKKKDRISFIGDWELMGVKTILEVCELLNSGTVYTAKEDNGKITTGEPVMVELRISKNGSDYKIGKMPNF